MIRLILTIILLLLCASGCNQLATEQMAFTLIRDVTDSNITYPKAKEIYPRFSLEENFWQGVNFRLTFIEDVEYGPEYNAILPGEAALTSNELERKKEIKNFRETIEGILNKPQISTRDYSVVYPVIVREINRMAKLPNMNRKVLAIYSDLIENTDLISLLGADREALKSDSGKVWKTFQQKYGITLQNDLKGLEIYFVYQAKDIQSSHDFSAISALYRKELEKRGAQVFITANL